MEDLESKINNVLNILKISVAEFYFKDETLRKNGFHCHDGMEQASAFRIGHYFCKQIEKTDFHFYDIDMEYNKHKCNKKCICGKDGVRPDLIMHKRGIDDYNLLVVEFKYGFKKDTQDDENKLIEFTRKKGDYKYDIGALIVLENNYVEYRFFQDGEELKKEKYSIEVLYH